jgi:transposase InsO family protein
MYMEELNALIGRGLKDGIDPMEMLVFLDKSAYSEKAMFRNRSWSHIGLLAYTRSELVSKVRCLVLPALDVDGYLARSTLIVEGAVTQLMYKHWLEEVILPQCEPFLGKRSIIIMDNCSTYHLQRITELCKEAGVRLLYLPPYSPYLNPIEQTFHLLKH